MITELKPTNLIAIEVPKDSKDFCVKEHIVRNAIDSRDEYELNFQNGNKEEYLILRYNYKIVGTVIKDKIGFDVEPYVNCISANLGLWENYNKVPNYLEYQTKSKEESFYSLLAANRLYFENPVKVSGKHIVGTINKLAQEWQSFEDKLITGKLLILEKL